MSAHAEVNHCDLSVICNAPAIPAEELYLTRQIKSTCREQEQLETIREVLESVRAC